jgi:hypothetical protein
MSAPLPPPRAGMNRPPAGGAGLLTAAALFAVLCGLILLLSGGMSGPTGDTPEQARHKRMVKASTSAARSANKAKGALESANYGAAKRIIEQQQQEITRLQAELEASAPPAREK